MTTTFIAAPAVVVTGWVVKANLVAPPMVTPKLVEVVPVKVAAVAVMVHPVAGTVPTVTLVNVATPETAGRVIVVVPLSVVPVTVRVIVLAAVGTILPSISSTPITIGGLKAAPTVVVEGWTIKANLFAARAVILKSLEFIGPNTPAYATKK